MFPTVSVYRTWRMRARAGSAVGVQPFVVARAAPEAGRHLQLRFPGPAALDLDVVRGLVRVRRILHALQGEGVPISRVPQIVEGRGVLAVTHLVTFDQGDGGLEMLVAEHAVHRFRGISPNERGHGDGKHRDQNTKEGERPYAGGEVYLG